MGNVNYDSSLDFGTVDLSGADTAFPNILNLGPAINGLPNLGGTDADRKKVDILSSADVAGGTAITVKVQGTDDDPAGVPAWTDVGVNTVTLAELQAGKGSVAVSPNAYRYLQVTLARSGTFTAGTLAAQLNTYTGK
jgi:hypothetical protein